MKKKTDPRHKRRVLAVKALFQNSFRPKPAISKNLLAKEVLAQKSAVDKVIEKLAPNWPIHQISQIDLAILRLAIWELKYEEPKQPEKVVIDEAVEIAKEYGNESSAGFVNGVLGTIILKSKLHQQTK